MPSDKLHSAPELLDEPEQVARRVNQLAIVAMLFTGFHILLSFRYGLYLSVMLLCSLFVCLTFLMYISRLGFLNLTRILGILLINSFLVLLNFAEGRKAGLFMYFLPILFAIPFMINNSRKYLQEILLYFSVTILSFLICIFLVPEISSWQRIPVEIYQKNFGINAMFSLLLTFIFTYLIIQTDRKYKQELFRQRNKAQEAAASRTLFLSNMGHELRTPLNGIIGAIHLLEVQPSYAEQAPYLKILEYCSTHMLNLVNDILDFNKIQAGKLELHKQPTNIADLLHESTLPFVQLVKEKKINLLTDIDAALAFPVLLDDVRFIQVINNLLSNAIKFTETGFVKITASITKQTTTSATIAVSVQDTGLGIEQENLANIFLSFWQVYNDSSRKYSGTGLGLSIVQHLLQLMNSELKVQSTAGKGSNFYFDITLDKTGELLPVNSVKEPGKEYDFSSVRIIVAEDNNISSFLVNKMLADKKAILINATNGKEVLSYLESGQQADIILLDLEMPDMDGYTTMKYLQKDYPYIPVIAFTATLLEKGSYDALLEMGFKDCILKPFRPEELFVKIACHLPEEIRMLPY